MNLGVICVKKLILSGFIFMLALCVLGCGISNAVVSDNPDNLSDVETFDADETKEAEETNEKEESAEYEKVLCYIMEYDTENAVLYYDQLEWIDSSDTKRINDLDLDAEYDFPNGFYIHNEDEALTTLKVSDTVKVYLVNIEDSSDPVITDMDGLSVRQAEYKALYHIMVSDNMVHIIEEQFIP